MYIYIYIYLNPKIKTQVPPKDKPFSPSPPIYLSPPAPARSARSTVTTVTPATVTTVTPDKAEILESQYARDFVE